MTAATATAAARERIWGDVYEQPVVTKVVKIPGAKRQAVAAAAGHRPHVPELRQLKGTHTGGQFARTLDGRVIDALERWTRGEGSDRPFTKPDDGKPFTALQLRTVIGRTPGLSRPPARTSSVAMERQLLDHHADVVKAHLPGAAKADVPSAPPVRKPSTRLTATDRAQVSKVASAFHEDWRKTRLQADGTFEPRVKTTKDQAWIAAHGTDQVDIANSTYDELPDDWKAENKAAAEVVQRILKSRGGTVDLGDEKTRLQVGEEIHQAWLGRNSWARGGELDVPFAELPRGEQDKDTDQLKVAMGALTPPAPPVKKAAADFGHGYASRVAALGADHGGTPTVEVLEGGISSKVELLTYPDGTRIVRKDYGPNNPSAPKGAAPSPLDAIPADHEELAAQVLDAFGVPAPAVRRVNDHTVDMEFVGGKQGGASGVLSAPANIRTSDIGRRLGLADAVMGLRDRNGGGWMRVDGGIVPIDNGNAFMHSEQAAYGNPFAGYLMTRHGWKQNELDRAELADVRARLVALRPQFVALGRGRNHKEMLDRLDAISAHAPARSMSAPSAPGPSDTVSQLRSAASRADAEQVLKAHSKAELQDVARELNVPFTQRATKPTLTSAILDEAGHGEVPTAPTAPKVDSPAEKASVLQSGIMDVVNEKADRPVIWEGLAELRDRISGTREDQDAALMDLLEQGRIRLIPEENRKTITPRDRAAALNVSGEDKHLVGISQSIPPRAVPAADSPAVILSGPAGKVDGHKLIEDPDFGAIAASIVAQPGGQRRKGTMDADQFMQRGARGDEWLAEIAHRQGFDGPPQVLSTQAMDAHIAAGGPELWRGVASDAPDSSTTITGDPYFGHGAMANGIHTSTSRAEALRHAGGNEANVHRLSLTGARVATVDELRGEYRRLFPGYEPDTASPAQALLSDPGRLAAALGYDAVHNPRNGRDNYIVVNRTALMVEPSPSGPAAILAGLDPNLTPAQKRARLRSRGVPKEQIDALVPLASRKKKVQAAAGHDVTPGHNQLHHWWTRGPGLARWAGSPKPWETLLANLVEEVKGVPLETLKKWTSRWFFEVKGYYAGSDANRVAHGHPPRGHKVGPG